MLFDRRTLTALLLAATGPSATNAASGSGTTTRYWDCCKPSCAWPGKASLSQGPLKTCDINDNPLNDDGSTVSGCDSRAGDGSGASFMCSSNSPWAVNDDLAYGWAAANIGGGSEASWCCACYELTFTSGPVNGKKMVVQVTNTGADLGSNHFDLAMPGGGVGIFNACTSEWGAPANGWGQQYGGISSRSECDSFPEALKDGCYWRFDWFQNADNPSINFEQVSCPSELTSVTGCRRSDD